MSVTIWHNPRCSKSRQTMALLEEQGMSPKVVLYLETPPSEEEIGAVLNMLGRSPRELMRPKEAAYGEAGLDNPALTREQLIKAMTLNPSVIERPVVIKDGKAAVGRPPEDVLQIL